jgi:hypothetical protein
MITQDTMLLRACFDLARAQGRGQRPLHAGRDDGRHEGGAFDVDHDLNPAHDPVSHGGRLDRG